MQARDVQRGIEPTEDFARCRNETRRTVTRHKRGVDDSSTHQHVASSAMIVSRVHALLRPVF